MDFIAPMFVLITGALVVGSIFRAHFVNKRLRENARAVAELQSRLIDKFGDAEQVIRYLESDAGKQLLAGAESGRGGPHQRVLDSLQVGIVTFLGSVGLMIGGNVSEHKVGEMMDLLGKVGMMFGIGFIVSALVSGTLMKSWGLLSGSAKRADGDTAE
jgi:hypothetical protein